MKSSVTENNTPQVRAGLDNRVTGSFCMQQPRINTLLSRPTLIREVLFSVTELILKLELDDAVAIFVKLLVSKYEYSTDSKYFEA